MEPTQWDKPGKGRLFVNTKKNSDKHPDFVGTFMTERGYAAGELIRFGMWRKETKGGSEFFNLSEDNFTPKSNYAKEDKEVAYRLRVRDDEDVPF